MTESVLQPHPGRLVSQVAGDRADAFRRAARHSSRVRRLRALVLLGAVALCVGVVVFAFYNPFRAVLPADVSIESAGLSGSRVTMARPKMSGYRKDGRPYDFVADSAVQDLKVPNVLQLNRLDAHVTLSDKSVAHVTADQGTYDSSKEMMDLDGTIRITSDSGYDIRMSRAHIAFKDGDVASSAPVSVAMKTGTVTADTMRMTGNGSEITFEGNVHSVMLPAAAAPARTPAPAATLQVVESPVPGSTPALPAPMTLKGTTP